MDTRERLVAGGIALSGATVKDVATSPLEARAYAHPALPGRTVVRLTPGAIGDATDVEMSVLGFGAPTTKTEVGTTALRALGFPEWCVVNDRKHARFALEVMQEFRKSARKIKSKPGFARDELVAIAKRLERSVPHFLPSFWEEAGRAFAREESRSFAAQCFEKARTAEASFKLKVDENERSRAYLEFALAGALSTKSLSGYAADLVKAFGPKDGYARFFDLAVQRTRGGVPPWVGMTKELRALGKGAGVSPADATRELLLAIIEAPSLARAPGDLWKDARADIVALAKRDPKVRARLRHLFPKPPNKSIAGVWLELLDEAGALDAFVVGHADADSEPPGATAKWAGALTLYFANEDDDDDEDDSAAGAAQRPSPVLRILDKLAPRLRAEGVPTLLASSDAWWRSFDVDVLEHAMRLEIPLEDPGKARNRDEDDDDDDGNLQISLDRLTHDPEKVAAHPAFGPLLVRAVAGEFGDEDFEKRAAGKRGLVAARRAWLEERISKLESGGLGTFREESKTLASKTTAATWAEFGDLRERLAKVNAEGALLATLQGGVLDELGWPAFEEVIAEHAAKPAKQRQKEELKLLGTLSRPIVVMGSKATVFDGDAVEKTVTLPSKSWDVHEMLAVGGALFVGFFDAERDHRGAWSTAWKEVFEFTQFPDSMVDFTLADGSVTLGGRAIHAGDRTFGQSQPLVTDGVTFWQRQKAGWREPIRCVELDPRSGEKGRASWPAFVAARTELDDGLRMAEIELVPAPKGAERSPLGVKDGLLGFFARGKFPRSQNVGEVGRIDGLEWKGSGLPDVLLTLPGSERPLRVHFDNDYSDQEDLTLRLSDGEKVLLTYGAVSDDPDDDLDDDEDDGAGENDPRDPERVAWSGFSRVPRSVWLHYLRPRDEKGSLALRKATPANARALLDEVREASGAPHAAAAAAVKKSLPAITDAAVRAGVARAVEAALAGERRLAKVLAGGGAGGSKGIDDGEIARVLPLQLGNHWGSGAPTQLVGASALFLTGEKPTPFAHTEHFFQKVLALYGKALAFVLTRDTVTEHREKARAYLRAYADSAYAAGMTVRFAELEIPDDAPIAKETTPGRSWFFTEGTSRYFVRCWQRKNKTHSAGFIVEAFQKEPRLPKDTTLEASAIVTVPDDRALLLDVLAMLEKDGPVPFDVADAVALSELSGLSLPEAKLLLAGLPKLHEWAADFLGKELRTTLDIKVQDAKAAKATFEEMEPEKLAAMFAGALEGVTAAELRERSTPGAPAKWVRSMASAIKRTSGKRTALRPDLVTETRRMVGNGKKPELVLEPLLDPAAPSLAFVEQPLEKADDDDHRSLDASFVTAASEVWSHLAISLPIGDPYVEGIARAARAVRAALLDERTLLPFAHLYIEDKQREAALGRLGGKPTKVQWSTEETIDCVDNGVVVAGKEEWRVMIALRTSAVAKKDKAAELAVAEALVAEHLPGSTFVSDVRFLLSAEGEAWIAGLERDGRPTGKYDADPAVSAPKAVKKLAKSLGLGAEAARLYLELLVLPAPTDAFVSLVNGWDKKALAAAKKELVEKNLVVEGKRERAGRDVFLPGGWEARSSGWALPLETWKLQFLGKSKATVRGSIGAAYERAEARVASGDGPKFEEVAAVRKKKGKA